MGVQRDTVGAGGVDGEESADEFPDSSRLDCVFLLPLISIYFNWRWWQRESMSEGKR